MRIVFFTKRSPQSRDLLARPYGRFFNLPRELTLRGCGVTLILVDYNRSVPSACHSHGMRVVSVSVRRPAEMLRMVKEELAVANPDVVVGFSDMLIGILTGYVSRRCGTPYVIDAYDNYESYIPYAYPLYRVWRRVVRSAAGATVAGPQLQTLFDSYGRKVPAAVVPMAADEVFAPGDPVSARRALNLPQDVLLVGYSGRITSRKGMGAFRRLLQYSETHGNIRFVMSGRKIEALKPHGNLIQTGYLEDDMMPLLVNSLDIVISMNSENEFGRYSYPAKISEAKACGVRVLATDMPSTAWMLDGDPQYLFSLGDLNSLPDRMLSYPRGRVEYTRLESWENSASLFAAELDRALGA